MEIWLLQRVLQLALCPVGSPGSRVKYFFILTPAVHPSLPSLSSDTQTPTSVSLSADGQSAAEYHLRRPLTPELFRQSLDPRLRYDQLKLSEFYSANASAFPVVRSTTHLIKGIAAHSSRRSDCPTLRIRLPFVGAHLPGSAH